MEDKHALIGVPEQNTTPHGGTAQSMTRGPDTACDCSTLIDSCTSLSMLRPAAQPLWPTLQSSQAVVRFC